MSGVRHLYVHLPFCMHRCGYCDFVTAVGRRGLHEPYVEALLAELELERDLLAERLDTVFIGGGTPTFTEPAALRRLLAALPEAGELTIEANPETVTPRLAGLLRRAGVTRVSLGVQSFTPRLLDVLERRASPAAVRRAFYHLRDAGFDNISLDLVYGIPGQKPSDLEHDLGEALALGPEHLSCYELEAKEGTRFTVTWGEELRRQSEAMEGYYERVVDVIVGAGYRWYETANFCRDGRRAAHNLAYWCGHDYLGIGVGAVSTVGSVRRRNLPSVGRYLTAAGRGEPPPKEEELLGEATRACERLMLGLRLDEPVPLAAVERAFDPDAAGRLERAGLLVQMAGGIVLTRRGRFLGSAVTVELLAESPANPPVPAG